MMRNRDRLTEFDWIEWEYAGSDDLHDSGYRYITVVGVLDDKRYPLHYAADHIHVYGPVNIDVTAQGVMRIMPGDQGKLRLMHPGFLGSDAVFVTTSPNNATNLIGVMSTLGRQTK